MTRPGSCHGPASTTLNPRRRSRAAEAGCGSTQRRGVRGQRGGPGRQTRRRSPRRRGWNGRGPGGGAGRDGRAGAGSWRRVAASGRPGRRRSRSTAARGQLVDPQVGLGAQLLRSRHAVPVTPCSSGVRPGRTSRRCRSPDSSITPVSKGEQGQVHEGGGQDGQREATDQASPVVLVDRQVPGGEASEKRRRTRPHRRRGAGGSPRTSTNSRRGSRSTTPRTGAQLGARTKGALPGRERPLPRVGTPSPRPGPSAPSRARSRGRRSGTFL